MLYDNHASHFLRMLLHSGGATSALVSLPAMFCSIQKVCQHLIHRVQEYRHSSVMFVQPSNFTLTRVPETPKFSLMALLMPFLF